MSLSLFALQGDVSKMREKLQEMNEDSDRYLIDVQVRAWVVSVYVRVLCVCSSFEHVNCN